MNFKEKVQSMTAKEIIMAMVQGLRKPYTIIEMGTFGFQFNGICHVCAATNAICTIKGEKIDLPKSHLYTSTERRKAIFPDDIHFVGCFENAIDRLRMGSIEDYNYFAEGGEFAQIKEIRGLSLPGLENNYTEQELKFYEQLAYLQE